MDDEGPLRTVRGPALRKQLLESLRPPAVATVTATVTAAAPIAPRPPAPTPTSSAQSSLLVEIGTVLSDRYVIDALLGEGGMGQVFRATDRALDRAVAIKLGFPQTRDGLLDEARGLSKMRHRSLVSVHGVDDHDGRPFIIMELIEGVTVADQLARYDRGTPIAEALSVLLPTAEALTVVHAAGVAHRDIKPENIMVTEAGRLVLMDFGLVMPEIFTGQQQLLAGSPAYMPPESFDSSVLPGHGAQVDLYSLGVVAYEMLVGSRPFSADSLAELYTMKVEQTPPDVRSMRPDVPPKLAALIEQMMAVAPEHRPHSAEEVVWELKAIGRETPRFPVNFLHPETAEVILCARNDQTRLRLARRLAVATQGRLAARHASDLEEVVLHLEGDVDLVLIDEETWASNHTVVPELTDAAIVVFDDDVVDADDETIERVIEEAMRLLRLLGL